jgi:hypothetical protein
MARLLRNRVALALLGLGLAGCSLVAAPDREQLGPEPQICTPGVCSTCPCTDGRSGQQKCNAQSIFDPCMCPSDPACPSPGAAGSGS